VARSALVASIALIGVALAVTALAGCGQKGQLYLPSQKKSKVPPTQQPQGTPPPGTTPAPQTLPAPS
jgi:predicted small lipoprotein YifL